MHNSLAGSTGIGKNPAICRLALLFLALFALCPSLASAQTEQEAYNTAAGYHQSQKWDQAISALENFIQRYPKSRYRSAAELYLGHSYLARGNFTNAEDGATGRSHLQYVIDQGPKAEFYREASLQYAYSLFSLMLYDQALPALEKYVREFPNADDLQYALYYLGVTYSNLGKYSQALDAFSQCIDKFPNGSLIPQCQFEKAVALGKSGQYSQADTELQRLALNPTYPFRQKAALMRAGLLILQERYNDAVQMLNSYLRGEFTDNDSIIEANQYLAYCYMQMGAYDQALAAVDAIQARGPISTETAFLKIQILTKMGRTADAQALLEQVRRLDFSMYGSDIINYYQASILLAQGKWDDAINLLSFLNISPDPGHQGAVQLNYFKTTSPTQKKLTPRDFMEACGTLVLSLVSRYAVNHYDSDNTNQQAVFNAMYKYADTEHDPYLMTIVTRIDRERQNAFRQPIGANGAQGAGTLVVNNGPGNNGFGGGMNGSGGQSSNFSPNGAGQLIPSNQGGSNQLAQNGQNIFGPSGPNNGPNNFAPNNGGSNFGPNSGPNNAGPNNIAQNGYGPNNSAPNSFGPNAGNSPSTPSMTLDQANALYRSAQDFVDFEKYDQANEVLLKLLTTSDTIWQDAPSVAASAAYLRSKVLLNLGQSDDALTMWSTITKLAPNSPEAAYANYCLGYWADQKGRSKSAIDYYEKSVSIPNDGRFTVNAYYGLAWNEWEQHDVRGAEKHFQKIYREYYGSDYWGHAAWAAATIKFQSGDYVAAERIVNDALAQDPDQAIVDRLLLLKGEIAMRNKDYAKARVAFNTVVTKPSYPDSALERAARDRLAALPK